MMINGLGNGSGVGAPKPAGGDTANLAQQKKALQNEIRQLSKNDNLKPAEKQTKLALLQQKMQALDGQIQKASKNTGTNPSTQTTANKAQAQTPPKRPSSGKTLDTYV